MVVKLSTEHTSSITLSPGHGAWEPVCFQRMKMGFTEVWNRKQTSRDSSRDDYVCGIVGSIQMCGASLSLLGSLLPLREADGLYFLYLCQTRLIHHDTGRSCSRVYDASFNRRLSGYFVLCLGLSLCQGKHANTLQKKSWRHYLRVEVVLAKYKHMVVMIITLAHTVDNFPSVYNAGGPIPNSGTSVCLEFLFPCRSETGSVTGCIHPGPLVLLGMNSVSASLWLLQDEFLRCISVTCLSARPQKEKHGMLVQEDARAHKIQANMSTAFALTWLHCMWWAAETMNNSVGFPEHCLHLTAADFSKQFI